MNAFLRRLFGPCLFGHSADYLARRDAEGVLRKECPRCHVLYDAVLGSAVVKDGPAAQQQPVAGRPMGKAVYVEPRRRVVGGRFR